MKHHRSDRARATERPEDRAADRAFLRWLESRLARSNPEPSEDEVINYLIGLALSGKMAPEWQPSGP
jgi:hypothetical protein